MKKWQMIFKLFPRIDQNVSAEKRTRS